MKKLATLIASSLLIGSAFASTPTAKKADGHENRHWVINVGLFMPQGDHEDLGVDNGFMAGLDYCFGEGGSQSGWFIGIGKFFGNGDDDLKSQSYGIHTGVVLGLGNADSGNPWFIELRGGWYQTKLENDEDENSESGFGGSVALVYKPKSSGGHGVRFSLGWYTLPEVENVDNTGYFFAIGFPIGGK